jgi:hypothetical protein
LHLTAGVARAAGNSAVEAGRTGRAAAAPSTPRARPGPMAKTGAQAYSLTMALMDKIKKLLGMGKKNG